MERAKIKKALLTVFICALLYLVFDAPVRATGFLKFDSFIGIKCVIPIICGLLFGASGAFGCAVGSLAVNIAFAVNYTASAYEFIVCLISGIFMWLIWHTFVKNGRVNIKTVKNLALYLMSVVASSFVAGAIGLLFGGASYFAQIFIAYTSLGIIVGIPILPIAVSIVCIDGVVPPFRQKSDDIVCELDSIEDITKVNDMIEKIAALKNIPQKTVIEIESCIEEAVIRIFANEQDTKARLSLYLSDSISLKMSYSGVRYNPIKKQTNEDSFSLFSLALVRSRALRVGHSYKKGINFLHIVV